MPHDDSHHAKKHRLARDEACHDRRHECPHCGAAGGGFVRNGRRQRFFLEVCEGGIRKVSMSVPRWKCPQCRRSFTEYPEFALPFKRYTRRDILAFCEHYLRHEWSTYRDSVSEDGMPLFYPEKAPDSFWWKQADEDEVDPDTAAPALSHTALYRWLTTLAKLELENRVSSRTRPSSRRVSPNKFRSEERRRILELCAYFGCGHFVISADRGRVFRVGAATCFG